MLAILWMLRSGKKITAKQISEKLEMNIRTVYRYIDTLHSWYNLNKTHKPEYFFQLMNSINC
ncbi:HTH domain-containing protein [Bacillus thuringiensis]|nr:helix-turn-helix domain-containing protein [Bacillus thuringiensis]